jgi:cytidine deaminase
MLPKWGDLLAMRLARSEKFYRGLMGALYTRYSSFLVGAQLARDSGMSVTDNVECAGVIAGKPCSYRL